VSEQELVVGANFISVKNNKTQTLLSLYQQQYYLYIILTKTALVTSKQMYVYCDLCIVVYFNEILV